jgi:hypothetical protein
MNGYTFSFLLSNKLSDLRARSQATGRNLITYSCLSDRGMTVRMVDTAGGECSFQKAPHESDSRDTCCNTIPDGSTSARTTNSL